MWFLFYPRRLTLAWGLVSALAVVTHRLDADQIRPAAVVGIQPDEPANPAGTAEVAEALELFKQGRLEEALTSLQAFTRSNRQVAPAEIFLAQWAVQTKQPALARVWLDRAVRAAPEDPEAYVVLAHLNAQEQRWTEAGLLYDKAGGLVDGLSGSQRELPTRLRILVGRATVAEAAEDWESVEKWLTEFIARQPVPKEAVWQMLARALFQQGREDEALEKLQRAADSNPEALTPEAVLAGWYQESDDAKNAEKWMSAALERTPGNIATRLAAAGPLMRSRQFEAAIEQIDTALELDPDSLRATILRGNVALLTQDYETAARFLETAALQSPGNFPATNNLALALCEGNPAARQRALEYAELNVRRFPEQPEALGTLGWVLYKSDRVNEAESVLQKAVASGGKTPEIAFYLARVLSDRGKRDEAKRILEITLPHHEVFFGRDQAQQLLEELSGDQRD